MSGGIWLDNWRGLRNGYLLSGTYRDTLTQAFDTNGRHAACNVSYTATPLDLAYQGYSSSNTKRLFVRFGQSDTTPSASDYNLGDPVTTGLSYISVSNGGIQINGDTASRTYRVTVQNTAAASVTLREFGLFVYCNYVSGESGYSNYCMIYREVLDTPVTLAQYETATITFTVSLTLGDPVPGVS